MTYNVVSFSGGKDSTAMLLHMIELDYQIDEVITCDTGYEFPAMYRHIDKINKLLDEKGIKHTTLKSELTFEYFISDIPRKDGGKGYGWPSAQNRWCTAHFKTRLMNRYLKEKKNEYEKIIHYIGLAYDEQDRLKRVQNTKSNYVHPLVDWKWTEADAMAYCYSKGYDWEGLYKQFKRVSCYLCPLQPLNALRTLYNDYPELWIKMEELASITSQRYLKTKTLNDLKNRFEKENLAKKSQTKIEKFTGVLI